MKYIPGRGYMFLKHHCVLIESLLILAGTSESGMLSVSVSTHVCGRWAVSGCRCPSGWAVFEGSVPAAAAWALVQPSASGSASGSKL